MTKTAALMLAATSGWIASGSAAVIYNEATGGDLSNNSGSPSVLTGGTDMVNGTLHSSTDRDDHFIISNLVGNTTARFDYTSMISDSSLGVQFIFSNPTGGILAMSPNFFSGSNSGFSQFMVPASGEVKVSVQNFNSTEGGSPTTTWQVSTNDVIPETSTAALVALGALLAMRRSRH
jgi:hypothetical protein